MALESFYGGKQGVSPVIKAKFKYINTEDPAYKARYDIETQTSYSTKLTKEEARWLNDVFNVDTYKAGKNHSWTPQTLKPFTMNECLKDVHYTDVWYGELCIIDTDNKLNPYNGMLFKRTLKQYDNRFAGTELTLYAEYIGQIVGPSGGVPNFDFGSIETERKKAVGKLPTYETDIASETQPLPTDNWEYSYPKDNSGTVTKENPQGDDTKIAELLMGDGKNIEIVPGKDGNVYHDTIKYTWCNVRRKLDGEDDDAWIYLGFEIPYSWFDVGRTEIQYWDPRTNLVEHSQKGTDNKEHPFYHNLHFYIPRGARGIGPEELFIVGKDNHNKPATLYNFNAIQYQESPQETSVYDIDGNDIKDKSDWFYIPQGASEKIVTEKTYWVAKWNLYNPKTKNKKEVYQYIGAYKDIDSIILHHGQTDYNNDGTVEVHYSDGTSINFNKALTWITNVNVDINKKIKDENTGNFIDNPDYGKFVITFNNDKIANGEYVTVLPLIKSVTYTDNTGKITFTYSGSQNPIEIEADGIIQYDKNITINNIPTSNDYGKVTITKNTRESRIEATLPLIKNVVYDKTTGKITFTYSGISDKTVGNFEYITQMRILENGTIQTKTNLSSSEWTDVTNGTNTTPIKLKDIKDAYINDTTGHLIIVYRDNTEDDVGQVKTKPIISPVLRLKNGLQDGIPIYEFNTIGDVENKINYSDDDPNKSPYIDPQDSTTIVENDGTIQVAGADATGGILAATVGKENYLYYFDKAQNKWVNLGTLGSSGGGSSAENLTIEKKSSLKDTENYSVAFDGDSRITFKDGTQDIEGSTSTNVTNPITWPWEARNN